MARYKKSRKTSFKSYLDQAALRQKKLCESRKNTHTRLSSVVENDVKFKLKEIALIKNITETQVIEDLITAGYNTLFKRVEKAVDKLRGEGMCNLEIQVKIYSKLKLNISEQDLENIFMKLDEDADRKKQKGVK